MCFRETMTNRKSPAATGLPEEERIREARRYFPCLELYHEEDLDFHPEATSTGAQFPDADFMPTFRAGGVGMFQANLSRRWKNARRRDRYEDIQALARQIVEMVEHEEVIAWQSI